MNNNKIQANRTVMQSKREEWGSIGYSFLPCAPVCCDSINSAMLHFHQGLFMFPGRIKEHEHTQMCSHRNKSVVLGGATHIDIVLSAIQSPWYIRGRVTLT